MIPAEARKLWINALRSGRFKQTVGYLKTSEGYCCLGVACELYQEVVGGLTVNYNANNNRYTFNDSAAILPKVVREWLGLTEDTGEYVTRSGNGTSLTEQNDSGLNFDTIANIIEGQPDGLLAARET